MLIEWHYCALAGIEGIDVEARAVMRPPGLGWVGT